MVSEQDIQNYLATRRDGLTNPSAFKRARTTLLNFNQADVIASFDLYLQKSPDEYRAEAIAGLTILYGTDASDSIIRWINDESLSVRHMVCGCLHDYGDHRAKEALIDRLRNDSESLVRGMAADALGEIGVTDVLPDLFQAWQEDREVDELGHSPSSMALESMTDVLLKWVTRKLNKTASSPFAESTDQGQLKGRVTAESIPFDAQGRITHTQRYSHLPRSAFGCGRASLLDLQTDLEAPFEIDVQYVDEACSIRRLFVFQRITDSEEVNWAIHTILDAPSV